MNKRTNEAKWIESAKRWQINVQMYGIRKTFVSSIHSKKGKIEAERKADNWLNNNNISSNSKLKDIFERFLKEIENTTGKLNYNKNKSIYNDWIYPNLKNKCIDKITQQDWQDIINKAVKEGIAKKTCQNIKVVIASFTKYCRKNKIPIESVEFVSISKNAYTKGKNENAQRVVALSKYAVSVLNDQKLMLKELNITSKWVFPNQSGEMIYPHYLSKPWNRYRKHYNINFTIHGMRHTLISLSKDIPKELLKNHVGHSDSMDTFGIYGHKVEGEHLKLVEMFDNIFKNIIE